MPRLEPIKRIRHWARRRSVLSDPEWGVSQPLSETPEKIDLQEFKFIPQNDISGVIATHERGWKFHHSKVPKSGTTLGYFHNASIRLTTNVNIELDATTPAELSEIVEEFKKKPNYDEYTEIIVDKDGPTSLALPTSPGLLISDLPPTSPLSPNSPTFPLEEKTSSSKWRIYFVDHFNRVFLSQPQFDANLNDSIRKENASDSESLYRQWMALVTSEDSHYYKVSENKNQSLGRKIAQQIIWDYQTAHVVKDIDIENSFSMSDCSSLLSALQKKRVSDKQCQKIIKAVIQRFLSSNTVKRPKIGHNFSARVKSGRGGPFVACGIFLVLLTWSSLLLHVPFAYFHRLETLSRRADKGEYVPDLWKTLIKSLLKEWSDLNIVLALILAANVSFLALPGTSVSESSLLSDVSRGAGIVSMFMTMSGLLTSVSLMWLHRPLLGTGTFDAYRYIIGPTYKADETPAEDVDRHDSFAQLVWMASYLGMPLVLLLWSVVAFVVSAATWIFLYSAISTRIVTVIMCGIVLLSPVVTLLVFRGPTISGDSLFAKMLRSQDSQTSM